MFRICTRCNLEKPATAEYFHAYKRAPDGRRSICRECRSIENVLNNDALTAKKREHYRANRERLNAISRKYYADNVESQRISARNRYQKNREIRIQQMRKYLEENREEINSKRRPKGRDQFHLRYRSDVGFNIRHRLRSLIRVTIKNGREGKRMAEILGYTADDLKDHLERQFTKGMNWEKFMSGEIHIDHIIPASKFKIASVEDDEFKACWSLSNLRPLWASENFSKGAKVQSLV